MTSERHVQVITKLVVALGSVIALVALALFVAPTEKLLAKRSVLKQVQDRGYLKCGITGHQPAFSLKVSTLDADDNKLQKSDHSTGLYESAEGLEADLCKAIAIAIFGEWSSRLYFRNLDANFDKRIEALHEGEIDILFRSTSMRALNNVAHDIDQGPVVLFDPVTLLTPIDVTSINDAALVDARICAIEHTLPNDVMKRYLNDNNTQWTLLYKEPDETPYTNFVHTTKALQKGNCTAILGRYSTLYQYKSRNKEGTNTKLIPLGKNYHVPLVPIFVENDSDWHDLILQTIWTLLDAEIKDINTSNIPSGYREAHWRRMSLDVNNAQNMIRLLGNYGEIYQRNFGDILPERGANQHYLLSPDGALFSAP